jgi:multidrug efflux pump subunit AcrB
MWIVQIALRRPYTFVVLAILILVMGGAAIFRTPTDIFPDIDIPVVSIIWSYNGLVLSGTAHGRCRTADRSARRRMGAIESA